MSLSTRRYQQPSKNMSSFVLTKRSAASKQQMSSANSSMSLPKNPQLQIRLPSLSRSSMRKSFSIFQSDRNTKFKLQTLQQKLEQIKHSLHNTRQETKQTIGFSKVLRETLIEKQLANIHKDLKQQVQGLQSLVKITNNQHKERSNDLRDECGRLWDQTQQIKNLIFELRMKVQDIERNMGYKQ